METVDHVGRVSVVYISIGAAVGRERMNGQHVFFFFQAEDGIRDYKVTGVQTCALPICHTRSGKPVLPPFRDYGFSTSRENFGLQLTGNDPAFRYVNRPQERDIVLGDSKRSEERRVGKSVDLGGRRIIKKKKKRVTMIVI